MGATIYSADWLVPVESPPLRQGAVCVNENGIIVAVGPGDAVAKQFPHARHHHTAGTMLPALVNAHTHVELSALAQQVPGGDGLVPWVGRLMRANAEINYNERLQAAHVAVESLWQGGTAGLGDVGNQLVAAPALAARPLLGSFFHELLGSQDKPGSDVLALSREDFLSLVEAHTWPTRFAYVQTPHAPYSASAALLTRLFQAAVVGAQAASIHVAEDPQELALLLRGEGAWCETLVRLGVDPKTRSPGLAPVPYLATLGAFAGAGKPLLVHMCHASANDLHAAATNQAPVVLCARSNLHITGQLPNVPAMLEAGVTLALGTDSLASNTTLSLWDEMATLADEFPQVPAAVWITAATKGGAHALQRPSLGALAPGKSPGLIALDLNDPEPLLALVHSQPTKVIWILEPN